MDKSRYDNYVDTLTFLINGRRQNLCWLMSHCSVDREDAWRDSKFKSIINEIDAWNAELSMVVREAEHFAQ